MRLALDVMLASLALIAVMPAIELTASASDDLAITDPVRTLQLARASWGSTPEYVRLRNVAYAGSGCPAGSTSQHLALSYQSLALALDQFVAEIGPGVPSSESRKICQVTIDLDFPNGWQYSLDSADFDGYLNLGSGVSATQSVRYYFQGQSQTTRLSASFRGPDSRYYHVRDALDVGETVWSPCGGQRPLNVDVSVSLYASNPRAGGLVIVGNEWGDPLPIGIRWQRCR
jgi:hypothetical protein